MSNRLEEIDELGKVIAASEHFGERNDEYMLAQDILDAGYCKQAVKEFAEKLKEDAVTICFGKGISERLVPIRAIDNRITELYGGGRK